ncbi:hypothetical protein [Streptomyces sennicomposti]
MSDLPPDPPRLRAILEHLERQVAPTRTLVAAADAVLFALAATSADADTDTVNGRRSGRPGVAA